MNSIDSNFQRKYILRVRNLSLAVKGRQLLSGVNFNVTGGEIIGLNGPSGCGKTTLLRTIAGLVNPISGEIFFEDRSPESLGWPEFRRMVSYLEQTPVMLNGTVNENLRKPFSYKLSTGEFSGDRVVGLFERVLLDRDVLSQNARQLSVGQKQRVSFVRTLLVEPRVLLLDEPTSALDQDAKEAVEQLITEIVRERDIAAVIVSHDREQAERMCTRQHDVQQWLVGNGSAPNSARGGGGNG